MAISSVRKKFVINDDKTCIALAKVLKKMGQSLFLCDYPK